MEGRDQESGSSIRGTKPSPGAAITDQVLLATTTFTDPCGTIANQVLTLTASGDVLAVAEGIITWCRMTDSADTFCVDMDVTINEGNGAVKIDSTQVYSGGTIRILSAALSD